jgi:hypothetical protein
MLPKVPGVSKVPGVQMRAALLALITVAIVTPASAQTREPLPWFAIDLHAATVGLPQAERWVPEVSGDTELPGRNWGVSAGATVYPFRLGLITFGFGASVIRGRGTSESLTIVTGSGATATTRITPAVHTAITSLVPQISINFGRKLGWSYLSAGLGRSKVTSFSEAVGSIPGTEVPEAWNQALNFGGGARWFMKPHLGAGFDVRFVKLGSRSATATLPAAKRTQVWTISAGITMQ